MRELWIASAPQHPEAGKGGTVEAINGPNVKPTFAIGSLEWQREQEGKR